MMTIGKLPLRDLMALQDRMNRMFDGTLRQERGDEELESASWIPAVDIYETRDAFVVMVEAPGMTREQFSVEVREDTLTLKGDRPFERDVSREQYHRIERSYGRFKRTFVLGAPIRNDAITATYKNGVLEVTLPKVEEAGPKKIEITG